MFMRNGKLSITSSYLEMRENIAAKVFTEVMTLPFGEGNKIIHTDSDSLIGSLSNEDNNQQLENHLSRIPSSNLLLITGNKKPDSRRTVVKTILKYAQQEELSRPKLG